MKPRHLVGFCLALLGAAPLVAQPAEVAGPERAEEALLTAVELEELLGPIALHPDALVALILPASTAPSDIVLAVRRLQAGATAESLENEPWDDSVKALLRYPEILRWLDENLAWTKQLGETFAAQPAEVMNAVQRLRSRAQAAGTLKNTAQQRVVEVDEQIRIVPSRRDVIYVPRYDPRVVYLDRPVYVPTTFLTFGIGYSAGHWLAYDCDWRRRTICVVPRHDRIRVWRERRDWAHRIYWRPHHYDRWDDCWQPWRPRPYSRHIAEDLRRRWPAAGVPPATVTPGTVAPGMRPPPASWRRDGDRDPFRPPPTDTVRRWERPPRVPGERPPPSGWSRREDLRPGRPVTTLPSGPAVRPVPDIRPVPAVRPVPGVRPLTPVRRAPDLVRTPSPNVRPAPSIARPAPAGRPSPAQSPNGRIIPQRDNGPASSRGTYTRSPNGRWMPSGRQTPDP